MNSDQAPQFPPSRPENQVVNKYEHVNMKYKVPPEKLIKYHRTGLSVDRCERYNFL